MDDLRDLAAAYVMDALEPDERAAFERHLETDPALQAEVATLREGAAVLGDGLRAEPPARLRAAVLDAVASTEQDRVVTPLVRRPMYRTVFAVAAAAVVLVVLAVAGSTLLGGDRDQIDEVLGATDAVTVAVESAGIRARFIYSVDVGAGVFVAESIPPIGEDQTYELWLIDDSGPAPAGLFTPDGEVEVLVEGPIDPSMLLGLTVEPAGGSDLPTGDILFAEPLA